MNDETQAQEYFRCLNIVVYYDNSKEVVEYIKQADTSSTYYETDYIVSINKGGKEELTELLNYIAPEIKGHIGIIDPHGNIGYLNAMLFSISQLDLSDYKFIILSNTDISFKSSRFYDDLLKKEYPKYIGCIAPSVTTEKEDCYSNPHYVERISKEKLNRLCRIFSNRALMLFYSELSKAKSRAVKGIKQPSQFVYSPHGCFMIFSNDFAKKLLQEVYPPILYSEESFIGEMLIRNDLRCYYDSSLEVVHFENTTTRKLPSKEKCKFLTNSLKYIVSRFYEDNEIDTNSYQKLVDMKKGVEISWIN